MEYTVRKISEGRYQINIVTQNEQEVQLIKNASSQTMEYYYHTAVANKLGSHAVLLEVEINDLYPWSVIGKIKFPKGISGV